MFGASREAGAPRAVVTASSPVPRLVSTPQSHQIYEQYERTPLWRALQGAIADLEASNELAVGTAPRYVLGYLCQELAAKWVVTGAALTPDR